MSDTPETDEALNAFPQHHSGQRLMVLAAKLERERDEATEIIRRLRTNHPDAFIDPAKRLPWEGADNE
jgi:hypothetical protein